MQRLTAYDENDIPYLLGVDRARLLSGVTISEVMILSDAIGRLARAETVVENIASVTKGFNELVTTIVD